MIENGHLCTPSVAVLVRNNAQHRVSNHGQKRRRSRLYINSPGIKCDPGSRIYADCAQLVRDTKPISKNP